MFSLGTDVYAKVKEKLNYLIKKQCLEASKCTENEILLQRNDFYDAVQ